MRDIPKTRLARWWREVGCDPTYMFWLFVELGILAGLLAAGWLMYR